MNFKEFWHILTSKIAKVNLKFNEIEINKGEIVSTVLFDEMSNIN